LISLIITFRPGTGGRTILICGSGKINLQQGIANGGIGGVRFSVKLGKPAKIGGIGGNERFIEKQGWLCSTI
jgi:hypothetical protein